MSVTVLLVALSMVAIALVLTALRVARPVSSKNHPTTNADSDPTQEADGGLGEMRRGDRPNPPATPAAPGPDNVSPFYRPDGSDERR